MGEETAQVHPQGRKVNLDDRCLVTSSSVFHLSNFLQPAIEIFRSNSTTASEFQAHEYTNGHVFGSYNSGSIT